jgi:hypothetical protein
MLIQIKSLIYDSSRIGRRFALIYTDNIFFCPGYAVQGSAFWVPGFQKAEALNSRWLLFYAVFSILCGAAVAHQAMADNLLIWIYLVSNL